MPRRSPTPRLFYDPHRRRDAVATDRLERRCGTGLLATSRGRLPKPVAILLLVFLAVFTLAALPGDTPMLSLVGRFPRYEGLPVVAMYAAALWIGARSFGPKSVTNRDTACAAIAVSAMAMASVVVMQSLMQPGQRVPGLLNSAMVTGTFGLISVGMLGWKIWSEPRLLWILGALSGLVVIVLAGSRGALLGLVPAVLLTALWRPFLKPSSRFWWIAPALAVLVTLGGVVAFLRYQEQLTLLQRFTDKDRLAMWGDTWQLVLSNPIFGVGPGQFVDSIGAYHGPDFHRWAENATHWDSPHSGVLQVLAAMGFVGLAVLVALLGAIAIRVLSSRTWDPWRLGAVTTAIAVGVSFGTSFTDPITAPIVALAVGGAVSVPVSETAADWRHRVLAGLALLVGLILGGTLVAAEAVYSEGIYRSQTPAERVLRAVEIRPWDADLARRVAFTLTVLADRGQAEPEVAVQLAERTCPRLPGSVECLHVLAEAKRVSGDVDGALAALREAEALDPYDSRTQELLRDVGQLQ